MGFLINEYSIRSFLDIVSIPSISHLDPHRLDPSPVFFADIAAAPLRCDSRDTSASHGSPRDSSSGGTLPAGIAPSDGTLGDAGANDAGVGGFPVSTIHGHDRVACNDRGRHMAGVSG